MRRIIPLFLLIAACGDSGYAPPGREYTHPFDLRAKVEIIREIKYGTPIALPDCGAFIVGGRAYAVNGEDAELDTYGDAGDPIGLGDVDGDGIGDLVTESIEGELRFKPGAGCRWRPSWISVALPLAGVGRTVSVDSDRVLVGWSDGPKVVRSFRRAGGAWYEEPIDEPLGLSIRRTWFVRAWRGRVFYGLDAGEAYTMPPLPEPESWRRADPMGATEVRIKSKPYLFVGGLPSRTMLFDVDGVDHAEEAGIRGPELLVTWQSAATDLDGDGRDDVIALALAGHNSMDGGPAHPRVLIQIDGGRFATIPVDGPRLYATWIGCMGSVCAATGPDGGVIFRVTVR